MKKIKESDEQKKLKEEKKNALKRFYDSFIPNSEDRQFYKDEVIYKLFKRPPKEMVIPHFYQPPSYQSYQADLLYLPEDEGNKYALVVTDVGSRLTDVEPLKEKSSKAVKVAFEKIFKRKILPIPESMITLDQGTEFKGEVKKYFEDNNITVRYAQPGRSRQLGMVENKNGIIGKALLMRQAAEEILNKETSKGWIKNLPKVLQSMNKKLKRTYDPEKDINLPHRGIGDELNLLTEGTKVRVLLDKPIDLVDSKRLHGKFRAADIRYNPEPTEITFVELLPGQPPLYCVKNPTGVMFTKEQLQVASDNENLPPDTVKDKFIVEKIIGKKKIKNRINYLVKWKGYDKKHNEYLPRTQLLKEIPDLVNKYENDIKK